MRSVQLAKYGIKICRMCANNNNNNDNNNNKNVGLEKETGRWWRENHRIKTKHIKVYWLGFSNGRSFVYMCECMHSHSYIHKYTCVHRHARIYVRTHARTHANSRTSFSSHVTEGIHGATASYPMSSLSLSSTAVVHKLHLYQTLTPFSTSFRQPCPSHPHYIYSHTHQVLKDLRFKILY